MVNIAKIVGASCARPHTSFTLSNYKYCTVVTAFSAVRILQTNITELHKNKNYSHYIGGSSFFAKAITLIN